MTCNIASGKEDKLEAPANLVQDYEKREKIKSASQNVCEGQHHFPYQRTEDVHGDMERPQRFLPHTSYSSMSKKI